MLPGTTQVPAAAPGVFGLELHSGGVEPRQDDVELRQTLGCMHSRSFLGTTLLAAGPAEAVGGLGLRVRCLVELARPDGLEVRLRAPGAQAAALGSATVEHGLANVELEGALDVLAPGSSGQLEGSSPSVGTAAG